VLHRFSTRHFERASQNLILHFPPRIAGFYIRQNSGRRIITAARGEHSRFGTEEDRLPARQLRDIFPEQRSRCSEMLRFVFSHFYDTAEQDFLDEFQTFKRCDLLLNRM